MGLFTTVQDPETGQSWQIKTGHDSMDTYQVGDCFPHIQKVDGVYRGNGRILGPGKLEHCWVVIRHGIIERILPYGTPDPEDPDWFVNREAELQAEWSASEDSSWKERALKAERALNRFLVQHRKPYVTTTSFIVGPRMQIPKGATVYVSTDKVTLEIDDVEAIKNGIQVGWLEPKP